jgi:NAD(P)-dependent dehydrogenase (short-subunit alcohol dehydrogenase family)
MGLLDGKVAFITGGASGIGEGTALRFVAEGARVAIADLQADDAERVVKNLEKAASRRGVDAIFTPCDVSQPTQVRLAIEKTVGTFGRLDCVFANAGINGVWAPIEELQPDEWDRTQAINLRSTYLSVHYAIPHLITSGGGSVIVCSSVNGTRTFSTPGASAYSTSKAGQIAFMKMAALELARHKIRVNAVCPGAIETNIDQRTTQRDTQEIGIEVQLPKGNPALNEGQGVPRDVADVVLFLACDLSRHVSGVEIYVDGGASLLR